MISRCRLLSPSRAHLEMSAFIHKKSSKHSGSLRKSCCSIYYKFIQAYDVYYVALPHIRMCMIFYVRVVIPICMIVIFSPFRCLFFNFCTKTFSSCSYNFLGRILSFLKGKRECLLTRLPYLKCIRLNLVLVRSSLAMLIDIRYLAISV